MKGRRKCTAKYISAECMAAIFNKLPSNKENSNIRGHKEQNDEERKC